MADVTDPNEVKRRQLEAVFDATGVACDIGYGQLFDALVSLINKMKQQDAAVGEVVCDTESYLAELRSDDALWDRIAWLMKAPDIIA